MARHVLALAALLCAGALTACAPSAPPTSPVTASTTPSAPERAADAALAAATVIAEIVPAQPPPAVPPEPCIPAQAVDLIVGFEIGSPALYTKRFTRPVWPGAASGATVGVGYDLGYHAATVIAIDWQRHAQHRRMQTAAGITGKPAQAKARELADVVVEYPIARQVFDETSLVEYCRLARRAFGGDRFDAMPAKARGAIVSVVFNRGSSMTGPTRIEMRAIRDECVPAGDAACVARQLRAMKRLWKNSAIEAGMNRRRDAEAHLAEAA